jgi:two-component system, OmpR family, KDP operon response regulator KdpE
MVDQKILIIEDDEVIMRFLNLALKTNHYQTIGAKTGLQGLDIFMNQSPDLVLLDLGLPDVDGMDVLAQIRSQSQTPVIIISARGKEHEKVFGLDAGANDYITKPFNVGELTARIRVALRKSTPVKQMVDCFQFRELLFDFEKRRVFVKDQLVHLTPIEYKLLELLIENQGKVLTHGYIQRQIWGYIDVEDYQTLRVFMASIRRKIEEDTNHPRYIMTELGVGYRFVDE